MNLFIYPKERDCYTTGDLIQYARNVGAGFIIEIHQNAASATATGYETLVHTNAYVSPLINDIHNYFVNKSYVNRGIKRTSSLANCNRAMLLKVPYVLLEIGFISNSQNMDLYNKIVGSVGVDLKSILSKHGIGNCLIVFGHGGGDPGAVNGALGINERNNVRRIDFNSKVQGGTNDMTYTEVVKITNNVMETNDRDGNRKYDANTHWAKPDFNELLNSGLYFNQMDSNKPDYEIVATRGVVIRFINMVRKNLLALVKPSRVRSIDDQNKADDVLWDGKANDNFNQLKSNGINIAERRFEDMSTRAEVVSICLELSKQIKALKKEIEEIRKIK